MLAEDNALNAEVATELLGSLGLVVDWAENGSEAVDQFEASDPGSYFAIFMDMQMPVMEGIEATKKFETVCVRTMMFRFLR
ncbi:MULTISPECIES: response regulator [Lachnospiraceae]|uniref:response regulator n=1 Tax=Lachnospiraceae TaxID=186803 RepID=UPI001D017CF9|nr:MULTISPECIES: response regulator [Lachnospiraceae]MCB5526605.1 response regulator [Fusicatenibacter saccharivorans]MCB5672332.1 response regulator [Fusicatenibacter saccharivorans]MCB5691454.1 response regulator [Fusicatenibacter saccharivorans]MCB5695043.1 response regulator [Fusicatenibacter saccharivorans]MCC2730520.1 response regulator [Fusicatenibacter saccharivorans]